MVVSILISFSMNHAYLNVKVIYLHQEKNITEVSVVPKRVLKSSNLNKKHVELGFTSILYSDLA